MKSPKRSSWLGLALAGAAGLTGLADAASANPDSAPDATISDVRYEIRFDAETAPLRRIGVTMSFRSDGSEPVVLSLPSWTPGSYELDDYARNILEFSASSGGEEIRWDKIDFDSWRVFPTGPGEVTVRFAYLADNLDTGSAWSANDFLFFNGTNVFLYPEGQGLDFGAQVTFRTEPDWRVATGLTPAGPPGVYTAADFHEVVDMPTFVGRFDVDSAEISGVLHRLATYPEGALAGGDRDLVWDQLRGMMPQFEAVFDDMPFDDYTTLMVFSDEFGGASALEHRNSHLGIYARPIIGNPILASVVSHEIFHAWNVKRLRPVELVPYDYGRQQPTTLLWVSEGITSYYDDLSLVRGEVVTREFFYQTTGNDIGTVEQAGPVALEDASLTSWIGPRDGTGGIYYPKGALAGFLLDILIRDATDNEASLDDVMRDLYWATYKESFTGFSESAWWEAVERTAGGKSFEEFHARYVDGRDPYPWAEVLPLAGLALSQDTTTRPLVGIFPQVDDQGVLVSGLSPGGAAADAGVREGDYLLRAGPVEIRDNASFDEFRDHFGGLPDGTPYEVVVRRGDETITLEAKLRIVEEVTGNLVEDPNASERAIQIRESILTGG